jgi:putative ABC transport system permease protein
MMAFFVSHRTREIGLRVTLRARTHDVRGLVLRQGAVIAACGVGFGFICSLGLSRPMSDMLFGVSTVEPVVFIGVPILLSLTALLAGTFPRVGRCE